MNSRLYNSAKLHMGIAPSKWVNDRFTSIYASDTDMTIYTYYWIGYRFTSNLYVSPL